MFDLEQVDGYFETHLERAFWNGLEESRRRAAVRMAEYDVAAALGRETVDGAEVFQYCAVCEQALHLVHCDDARNSATTGTESGAEARIVAEEIDGIGSRRYEYAAAATVEDTSESLGAWSERALAFLERVRPPVAARFGRG